MKIYFMLVLASSTRFLYALSTTIAGKGLLWIFEFACSALLPLREIEKLKRVRLSPREQEILQLLCQGWRFQEIARQLGVEEATVQRYQRGIRASLKEPLEPERVCALEISVLAYLAGLFSPLADR